MMAYLDNNATTRPLPEVVAAMEPYFYEFYANPSSPHAFGQKCRRAVEQARALVAQLLGTTTPSEVVFTSSATESINHAFHIAWETFGTKGLHLVTSSVEHAAVLAAVEFYKAKGAACSTIPVDSAGRLDLAELDSALSKSPAFVSLMLANNETGVIFPIDKISEICKSHGALLHVDAVQAVGKMRVNCRDLGCDYLSISGHKFHAPKGIGALVIGQRAPRTAWIKGHQESGARGGTENVPGIVGLGAAAEATISGLSTGIAMMTRLRDSLEKEILRLVSGSQVNGDVDQRVCNTSNIYFPRKNSANLVERLSAEAVYVSAASACTTGGKPSHVLRAMRLSQERGDASLRFSVSKMTTDAEVQYAIATIPRAVCSSLDVFSTR